MNEELKKEIIKEDESRWTDLANKVGKEVGEFFDDLTTGTVHLREITNEGETTIAKIKISLDGDVHLDYRSDVIAKEELWPIFTDIVVRSQQWRMELWTAALKLVGLTKYFV